MTCLVKNCKNIKRLLPLDSTITFHRFPKEEHRFREWLKTIGINNENIKWKESMFVCSEHFNSNDLLSDGPHRQLKFNAKPHINIGENTESAFNSKLNKFEIVTIKEEDFFHNKSFEHDYSKCEEKDEDIKSFCRICTKSLESLSEEDCIYFSYQIEGREDSIRDCILTCVPQLDGHISDMDRLCHDCVNDLVVAVNFVEKCLKIQNDQKIVVDAVPILKMESPTFDINDDTNDVDDHISTDEPTDPSDFAIGVRQDCLGPAYAEIQSQLMNCGMDLIKADVDRKKPKKILFIGSSDVNENKVKNEKGNVTFLCWMCSLTFEDQMVYLKHCGEFHKSTKRRGPAINTKQKRAKLYELEDQKSLVLPETSAYLSAQGLEKTFPDMHISLTNAGIKTIRMLGGGYNKQKRVLFLGTWQVTDCLVGKRGVFRCTQCPKMFIHENEYFAHFKELHQHECTVCTRVFGSAKEVNVHMKNEHQTQNFECDKCNRKFSRSATLLAHQESFKDSITCTAKCLNCNAIFYSIGRYNDHISQEKCKEKLLEEGDVLCDKCGKQFSCQRKLITHKKNVHENIYDCMCTACGKICRNMQNLKQHMHTHDPDRVKTVYMCDQCPKKFSKKTGLLNHRAKFHENKILHKCEKCNKSFVTNSGLRLHHKHFHERQLPYKCHICSENFGRQDYLARHIRAHERLGMDAVNLIATGKRSTKQYLLKKGVGNRKKYLCEAPCLCKICNKMFSASTIKQHYRTHVKFRPHRCAHCSNTFTSYQNCKRHEKRHADPSYHLQCHICFNKFRKEADLEGHMQKHQDKMRYWCNICGKKFARVYMLENHKVNEHPTVMEKRKEVYNELIKEIVHVIQPGEEEEYIKPAYTYKFDMAEKSELQKALDELQKEY